MLELENGRPKDLADKLNKEIRTYDLLDKLGIERRTCWRKLFGQ